MWWYELRLNGTSVANCINYLEAYAKRLEKLGENMTQELTETGVMLAQQNAAYMDIYDSGELVDGIDSSYKRNKGYVESNAPHSAFCEFGTGIVGQSTQHPEPAPGWKYDVNAHGEDGWWYYDDYGRRMWTKGMPSRPYMYDTARMMRGRIAQMAKELLK